jgi:DNA-binding NarL/FixJ family response regulator
MVSKGRNVNATKTVSVVEDDDGIRASLAEMLNGSGGFRCNASYPDAEAALQKIPANKPDVVLMDINLPGLSGIECMRRLKVAMPDLRIVMLTVYDDEDHVFESLKAGADGYLLKRTTRAALTGSLTDMLQGGVPMSRQIARCVLQYFRDLSQAPAAGRPNPEVDTLTEREHEILQKLTEGYHYKEISSALDISIHTVRNHIRSIYEKLHVHSRTEAVVKHMARTH